MQQKSIDQEYRCYKLGDKLVVDPVMFKSLVTKSQKAESKINELLIVIKNQEETLKLCKNSSQLELLQHAFAKLDLLDEKISNGKNAYNRIEQ